ncbi:hypothetical protein LNTAR_10186 [Lentisphaera araneosa HTCC2155]|uniref:Uncharacterized protein n=1 Tax=Lentisphaera araneosa HTCC2155 TaxID=313628 RepID=A6DIJ0_9BACT|nr:hypothetical protein [Lentisphaera araneosa]EDM28276.1 hypothetical protein LNTAR_10186 [Lentisphaera araneosa HTCC2155]
MDIAQSINFRIVNISKWLLLLMFVVSMGYGGYYLYKMYDQEKSYIKDHAKPFFAEDRPDLVMPLRNDYESEEEYDLDFKRYQEDTIYMMKDTANLEKKIAETQKIIDNEEIELKKLMKYRSTFKIKSRPHVTRQKEAITKLEYYEKSLGNAVNYNERLIDEYNAKITAIESKYFTYTWAYVISSILTYFIYAWLCSIHYMVNMIVQNGIRPQRLAGDRNPSILGKQ